MKIAAMVFLMALLCCKKNENNPGPSVSNEEETKKEFPKKMLEPSCNLEKLPLRLNSKGKVIAIGDIHGDLSALKETLINAKVVDEKGAWIGGTTTLVQTGDVLDRGDEEPDIWAFLDVIEKQAEEAGGKVIRLNGNHEFMNVMGDFRYVTKDGFRDFSDAALDAKNATEDVPEFAKGRMASFAPAGKAALRISGQRLAVIVDETLFVHGGVTPEFANGLEDLNWQAQCYAAGQGDPPKGIVDSNGPLWTRAFSKDTPDCEQLKKSLEKLQIKRMVVGHTPQLKGITSACEEAVWRVDTGMAEYYNGQRQALLIEKVEDQTNTSILK